MNPHNRLFYLDALRSLATVAVIVLHVAAQNWANVSLDSYEWTVFNAADSAVRWCVPIFVMISGVLFLNPSKTITVHSIYKKSIFRLAVAFVVWSALYALDAYLNWGSLGTAVSLFIAGNYHMWFLFMMVGLYVITPILRKITESKEATKYFLAVSLICTFVVPRFLGTLSCIDNYYINLLYAALKSAWGSTHFHLTLGYSCYFVGGYFINSIDLNKTQRQSIYLFGVIGLFATIFLTNAASQSGSQPTTYYYDHMSLNVLATTIAVFVFAKYGLTERLIPTCIHNAISKFSQISFGVYLVHPLVLSKLDMLLGINSLTFGPLLSIAALTIVITLISALISLALRKLPLLGKFIA